MDSKKENQKSVKKSVKVFVFWLAGIVFFVFIVLTVYVKFYWKDLLVSGLSRALNRNVIISDVYYHPPFGLSAYKINIDGLLKADAAIVDFSFSSLIKSKIIISDFVMVRPEIAIVNQPPVETIKGSLPTQQPSIEQLKPVKKEESKQMDVYVKKIFIEDGKLKYSVKNVESAFEFALENLRLKAENILFPLQSVKTNFVFSGKLASGTSPLADSKVESSGWVDLAKKDMDGSIKVLESKNYAALTAHAVSLNNVMKVDGQLDMNQLPAFKDQDASSNINQIVYGALSNAGVKIGATFSFETQLDHFEVRNVSFSGSVITP